MVRKHMRLGNHELHCGDMKHLVKLSPMSLGRQKIYLISFWTCPRQPLWGRQWHPTPVLLPGKSHGRRSLVGCSPWGHWGSDTTQRLHFHFSLSCIGEGNGNPLQCSCLENPRDGGAWWDAVYGVAQSWTWLKRLSSSSSSNLTYLFNCPVSIYNHIGPESFNIWILSSVQLLITFLPKSVF